MSRVRQRSPRNSVDGDDDMSTGSASPAPLLPSSTKDVTSPSKDTLLLFTQRRPTRWSRGPERRLKCHGEMV